jgi:hypothetical protein
MDIAKPSRNASIPVAPTTEEKLVAHSHTLRKDGNTPNK